PRDGGERSARKDGGRSRLRRCRTPECRDESAFRHRTCQSEHCRMAALPLIVFDVNETLLDLQTMEPIFERIFGERQAMRLWFANFIMYSAALTVAGCYVPFTDIGAAVLGMLA